MEKYNLSVAVMQDDEPIMFLYSKEYEKNFGIGEVCKLFPAFNWRFVHLYDGSERVKAAYISNPDAERGDMYLMALWQEMK